MSHTPHELAEEFPDHHQKLQELRASDPHFAKIADKYHEINRAVHRAETDIEPTSDDHMAEMRKERMMLKDQVHGYLTK